MKTGIAASSRIAIVPLALLLGNLQSEGVIAQSPGSSTCVGTMSYTTKNLPFTASFTYDIKEGGMSEISDTVDHAVRDTLTGLLSVAASKQLDEGSGTENDEDNERCITAIKFNNVEFESPPFQAPSLPGGTTAASGSIKHEGDTILSMNIEYNCRSKCDGIEDSAKIEAMVDQVRTQADTVLQALEEVATQDVLFWSLGFKFNSAD